MRMHKETPLRDYFNRSGDDKLGLGWMEENEHGFCIWRRQEDKLILANVYGDGRYWDTWAAKKAEELGCTTISFTTKRNPAGFVRKYNCEVVGYIVERKV
jgi:hypothetical protein